VAAYIPSYYVGELTCYCETQDCIVLYRPAQCEIDGLLAVRKISHLYIVSWFRAGPSTGLDRCPVIRTVSFMLSTIISLTLRLLMSYIYGARILDVSRSHTTTQHSR